MKHLRFIRFTITNIYQPKFLESIVLNPNKGEGGKTSSSFITMDQDKPNLRYVPAEEVEDGMAVEPGEPRRSLYYQIEEYGTDCMIETLSRLAEKSKPRIRIVPDD